MLEFMVRLPPNESADRYHHWSCDTVCDLHVTQAADNETGTAAVALFTVTLLVTILGLVHLVHRMGRSQSLDEHGYDYFSVPGINAIDSGW